MDRAGADFKRCVEMIKNRLKAKPLPIQLPIGAEENFKGIIDLINMKAIIYLEETLGAKYEIADIPDEYKEEAEAARSFLLDTVAETDEELLEKYLGGEELTVEEIEKGC